MKVQSNLTRTGSFKFFSFMFIGDIIRKLANKLILFSNRPFRCLETEKQFCFNQVFFVD